MQISTSSNDRAKRHEIGQKRGKKQERERPSERLNEKVLELKSSTEENKVWIMN